VPDCLTYPWPPEPTSGAAAAAATKAAASAQALLKALLFFFWFLEVTFFFVFKLALFTLPFLFCIVPVRGIKHQCPTGAWVFRCTGDILPVLWCHT
jgi:hypothetical protein